MALDLIGQATHILNQANNGDGDELAFKRDVLDFKNCLLVEQPNGDFARTIVRQLLYSTWQHLLFQQLAESRDPFLSAIASKAVKEVAYHRELASEWTVRLGDGTDDSAARMLCRCAVALARNTRRLPVGLRRLLTSRVFSAKDHRMRSLWCSEGMRAAQQVVFGLL